MARYCGCKKHVTTQGVSLREPVFITSAIPILSLFSFMAFFCATTTPLLAAEPRFEVATIRHSGQSLGMVSETGGPGSADPGRVTYTNIPLAGIFLKAYDIPFYRLIDPKLLLADRYNITAIVPVGARAADLKLMLRDLLVQRFHLVTHMETRVGQSYQLVVLKSGSKLKQTDLKDSSGEDLPDNTYLPRSRAYRLDAAGFPLFDGPGMRTVESVGQEGTAERLRAQAVSSSKLAVYLSERLRAPVTDMTNLPGKYDFTLEFAPRGRELQNNSFAALPTALEKQLGVQLVSVKAPIEVVVIDQVDKNPSEN